MEELLGILTDDEDMIELIDVVDRQRARKIFRQRGNPFETMNDKEFMQRFRLSKNGVRFVLENISEEIEHTTDRNHAVSAEHMLLLTLRWYATGYFLQVVSDFIGIDKATASRIIHKVSRAIARLHTRFIKMPNNENEMKSTSTEFYNIARFPKCIGAIDCTHVKIVSPGGEEPEIYRNRKHFFSMNVQAVCDAHCKFEDIVCRWPGSSHDSTIFQNSRIRANCENGTYGRYLLVGDSGYGIKSYLITPLGNPVTAEEHLFNESQIRTRNPIERSFGIWKRRFPVLAFGIRLKLWKVESVVVATAVLHNIAILLNEDIPDVEAAVEAVEFVNNVDVENVRDIGGINNVVRYQLIHQYFNRLV